MLGLPYNITGDIMAQNTKILSSGLEDYIEAIYIASLHGQTLKGAELARKLNISRASVSEALSKLVTKGLIKYNSYEAIILTDKGKKEAEEVYNKHRTLKEFFEYVLGIPSSEAGENACKIEHIISQNILNKMSYFTEYCKENRNIIENFNKETPQND